MADRRREFLSLPFSELARALSIRAPLTLQAIFATIRFSESTKQFQVLVIVSPWRASGGSGNLAGFDKAVSVVRASRFSDLSCI